MVASDVTELVRLERHRETLAHAIVHDVRNPLTALRGICRIAADALEKHAEAALVTRLRSVDESVARVDRLLSDLLDVTLAETGRMHLSLHPVDVRHLIEDVASAWAAASHGHTLRAEGPRVVACADADRVRQVLENLVGNAIKYSPKGGPVLLRCEREGTRALVVVEDCGPGVPEQERRTIFDPYVRARSARAAAAGHGLGLFVASQLVRAHGGSIGVRPVDPHGASFWFTLPLAEGEAAE
jgi:two-component system CheB/CheR fusion protein